MILLMYSMVTLSVLFIYLIFEIFVRLHNSIRMFYHGLFSLDLIPCVEILLLRTIAFHHASHSVCHVF